MTAPAVVHVWGSPDEALEADEMLCTEETPFTEEMRDRVRVAFHPWSVIGPPPHYDYACRWCQTSTRRGQTQ